MELTDEQIQEIEQKPIRERTVEELKILDEAFKKEQQVFKEEEKQRKRNMKELRRTLAKINQNEFGEATLYLLGNFLRYCGWFFVVIIGTFTLYNLLRGKTENFFQEIVFALIAYGVGWVGGAMIKSMDELWELRKEKESNEVTKARP